jgi:hypothetical protein
MILLFIVFRSGPLTGLIQDLDFRFWLGRSSKFFFLKNQNDVVLVKIKVNGLQPDFWPSLAESTCWVSRVTLDFFFPCFFFNPTQFQFRVDRILVWPAGTDRILNLCSQLPERVKQRERKRRKILGCGGTVLDQGLQQRKITKYLMGFQHGPRTVLTKSILGQVWASAIARVGYWRNETRRLIEIEIEVFLQDYWKKKY